MSDRFLTDSDREPPGRRHPSRGRHPRRRDGTPSAGAGAVSSRPVRRAPSGARTRHPARFGRARRGAVSRRDRGRDARARHVRNQDPAARLHAPLMIAVAAAIPGPGIGPARAPPS